MDDDLLYSKKIESSKYLCISSVSTSTFQESDVVNLGSDRGYFIFELDQAQCTGGIDILGKVSTIEAAFRLAEILSLRAGVINNK